MKKLFSTLVASLFLVPLPIISTEKTPSLTVKEGYEQFKPLASKLYHDTIPINPNLYQEQVTYADAELTRVNGLLKPEEAFLIRYLTINSQQVPIFALSDGSFMPARLSVIYDDVVIKTEMHQGSYWLKPGFTVYDTPYVKGANQVTTDLQTYGRVTASELATAHHGTYVKIDGKGWLAIRDLSERDNRMLGVQELLETTYSQDNVAVYVYQLDTGLTAGVHQDNLMYSASVSKLPLLYYIQHQIDQGKIQWSDTLPYVPEVNAFKGAYQPSGSGHLPKVADGKSYTVEELTKAVAKDSDNVATNILAYHLTKGYGKSFNQVIEQELTIGWDMVGRQVSAKTAGDMMAALYEQNGKVLEFLSETRFDNQRIARDIEVGVAHKVGDAYDFKHDVAVIATESPVVLSIFTENASYDEISNIAKHIYDRLK